MLRALILIDASKAASVEETIAVNALFPFRLVTEAAKRGQRVIQLATDAVYADASGPYGESAEHDPHDVYGKTKSLGGVPAVKRVAPALFDCRARARPDVLAPRLDPSPPSRAPS